jgi:hypothetical protein
MEKSQNLVKNGPTNEQLNQALFWIEDIFYRSLLENKFILLKETARSIKEDNLLAGESIDIGIEHRYLTKEVRSVFNEYLEDRYHEKPVIDWDKGFTVVRDGITINVKFIKRKYGFFTQPDSTFYVGESYSLPNPFNTYWKTRNIIA